MTSAALAASGDVVLAHHALVVAVPAFVPALVIVGAAIWVARRDRRAEAAEQAASVPSGTRPEGDR